MLPSPGLASKVEDEVLLHGLPRFLLLRVVGVALTGTREVGPELVLRLLAPRQFGQVNRPSVDELAGTTLADQLRSQQGDLDGEQPNLATQVAKETTEHLMLRGTKAP